MKVNFDKCERKLKSSWYLQNYMGASSRNVATKKNFDDDDDHYHQKELSLSNTTTRGK